MKSDETHYVTFCFPLPSVYIHSGVRWANTRGQKSPSNLWLCKWAFRISELNQPQLKIAVFNTVQSIVGSNCFLSVVSWICRLWNPQIRRANCISWKKSSSKWTHEVQTCVIQGSTVHLYKRLHIFHKGIFNNWKRFHHMTVP